MGGRGRGRGDEGEEPGGGAGGGVIARTRAFDVSGCHMLRAVVSATLFYPSARAVRACITGSPGCHMVSERGRPGARVLLTAIDTPTRPAPRTGWASYVESHRFTFSRWW